MNAAEAMNTSLMLRAKSKLVAWVKDGKEMTAALIGQAITDAANEEAALACEMIEGKTERAKNQRERMMLATWSAANA